MHVAPGRRRLRLANPNHDLAAGMIGVARLDLQPSRPLTRLARALTGGAP